GSTTHSVRLDYKCGAAVHTAGMPTTGSRRDLPMASVYATVHTVIGQVYARSPDGLRRLLAKGAQVHEGEQIVSLTGEDMISLTLADGRMLDLGRDSQWTQPRGPRNPDHVGEAVQEVDRKVGKESRSRRGEGRTTRTRARRR